MNSAAEAFLHDATQAPQPMHWAQSIAGRTPPSATRMALPSGRRADVDRGVAAGLDDAVEGAAIDDQVLEHREGPRAPRLDDDRVAVLEAPHVQLADGGAGVRPCATPLTMQPQVPQMPSRQSESKAIGSSPP